MIRSAKQGSGGLRSGKRALSTRLAENRPLPGVGPANSDGGSASSHIVIARNLLIAVRLHLEVALAAAVVCGLALKGQDVEHDREIAAVVRRSVADELGRVIEVLDQRTRHGPMTGRNRSAVPRKAERAGRGRPRELRLPRKVLNDLCYRLCFIVGSATVCRGALEAQDAEMDREIATTLRHSVLDVLKQQIKRIKAAARAGGV